MDQHLRDEINKRLTLNWLIQGAAQHAGLTLHHLVRDEIMAIDPRLLQLYDQYALINLLQWWHLDAVLLMGWPPRFWKRAASRPSHPFFGHPLLSRYGGMLAEAARARALERCREKGVTRIPVLFSLQVLLLQSRIRMREAAHRNRLSAVAKMAASRAWGIADERFDAQMAQNVEFGRISLPRSVRGAILRGAAVGYGGVVRRNESLVVTARARNWQLLAKELVKGTAELICMHGLSGLDDRTYREVMQAADRMEYEPWMLQSGGELWRRVLATMPDGRPVAEVLMHMARLPAKSLESLMLAILERPEWAKELLAGLGQEAAT